MIWFSQEAQKTKTVIWWNIWVLLAMPAVWLAWAMVAFCVAIMSYIWRTGSSSDPPDGVRPPLEPGEALAVRVVLTAVFALGLVYFVMIVRTFASYGERETGWRRSWLATGHPGLGERARERRRQEEERERGRRQERERRQQEAQEALVDSEGEKTSPVMGLGLLGVPGNSASGMASMTSVLAEDVGTEKKQGAALEENARTRDKISPKL